MEKYMDLDNFQYLTKKDTVKFVAGDNLLQWIINFLVVIWKNIWILIIFNI